MGGERPPREPQGIVGEEVMWPSALCSKITLFSRGKFPRAEAAGSDADVEGLGDAEASE